MRIGALWAALPKRFGKSNSVCCRFRRLAQKGVWEAMFEAVKEPDLDWVMCDSTVVRAHQHSAGKKMRPCSRVPAPTHWATACACLATGGQARDCPQTRALLADLALGQVIADTSYDSGHNRAYCAEKGIGVVIPNRPNRPEPAPFVEEKYEDRNKIERFF